MEGQDANTAQTNPKPSVSLSRIIILLFFAFIFIIISSVVTYYYFLSSKTVNESLVNFQSQNQTNAQSLKPTQAIPSPKVDETEGWKTYTSKKYGYSLRYPQSWIESSGEDDWYSDIYVHDNSITTQQMYYPRITIRVIKSVGPQWKNTKEYFDERYNQANEENRLIFHGLLAFKGISLPKQYTEPYYDSHFIVFKDNKVYVLSNSATDQKTVDKYNAVFDQILSTFKFLNQNENINNIDTNKGFLKGKVNIGPLCGGAENLSNPCPTSAKINMDQEIIVYSIDQSKIIARVNPDKEGNYLIELPAGSYVVDIKKEGVKYSKDVPKQISIQQGRTTELNINIDTGIR